MSKVKESRAQLLRWIDEDQDDIVKFFSGLIRCKSPNPPGDTREAMDFVQRFLRERKLPFKEVNARADWPNIISSVEMPKAGRHLMLNGHLDVFPASSQPGWTDDPWSGKIADGRVWGRGAGDMKAGTTSLIFAYAYLSRLRNGLSGRLSLTVVSDEENGGEFGVGHMFREIESEMKADSVLSGESTTPRGVSFGGKGNVRFTVRVYTPGAHASAPFKSANAIRIACNIIDDLDVLSDIPFQQPASLSGRFNDPEVRALQGPGADFMPRITLNVGTIEGGAKVNVIASDCKFEFEARTPIGLNSDLLVEKAKDVVARYPEASIEDVTIDPPDFCEPDGELAVILQDTVESLGRVRPVMIASSALSDCKFWRSRGTPSYWYGPTPVAGTANESVSIDELLNMVRTHTLASAHYLSGLERH
jgi:acetylornithine deacetylase/succinyl-diaminopimelate desuccinylase-like protein